VSVLVTGATGYIGRRVALRLIGQGQRVRVFCRTIERLDPQLRGSRLVETVEGDISDPDAVARACTDITGVIHLAAAMSGAPEDFDRSTIRGTQVLVDAVRAAGVRRLVYVSSMSVYDYSALQAGSLVNEQTPLESRPELRDSYARSKRIAEGIVAQQAERGGVSVTIVRPGIVYGPGAREPLTPVTALRRIGAGRFALVGGGRRQAPLVYVENLVDALLLLLTTDSVAGRAYNVVDADPPSEREYLETLQRVSHSKISYVPVPVWVILPLAHAAEWVRRLRGRRGMDIVHGLRRVTSDIRFDTTTLGREVGWASRVSFAEAMRESFGDRTASGVELAA
jgi:nucleoside-diphosphate-sugar epimerase